MARDLSHFEFGRSSDGPAGGAAGGAGADNATATALTRAGLAALLLLPVLLLGSVLLEAPLAVPAAIALGYLAMANAAAARRPRLAAGLSIAVLSAFVGWTLLFLVAGEGPLSWAGLIAVSLAPLFAAAPAAARRLAPKADPARRAALADIACLERLASSEAVLMVDGSGLLLAGTRPGLAGLGLSSDAAGQDVTRALPISDRLALLHAIERCRTDGAPNELVLHPGPAGAGRRVAAGLGADRRGWVTIRLRDAAKAAGAAEPAGIAPAGPAETTATPPAHCELSEAIGFAVRHAAAKGRRRRVRMVCNAPVEVAAAADPRAARVVVSTLLNQAIGCTPPDGLVSIAAGAGNAVALVRISLEADQLDRRAAETLRRGLQRTAAAEIIDQAGGSLLVETRSGMAVVRLALPAPAMAACPSREHAETRGA